MHEANRNAVIFIFNNEGELLLQRRAASDDSYPLCLDFSAAGSIEQNESKDAAAARELREELGIETALRYVGTHTSGEEMLEIYRGVHDGPFHPDPKEVQEVAFCSLDEISKKVESGDQFHPEFLSVWADQHLMSRILQAT